MARSRGAAKDGESWRYIAIVETVRIQARSDSTRSIESRHSHHAIMSALSSKLLHGIRGFEAITRSS